MSNEGVSGTDTGSGETGAEKPALPDRLSIDPSSTYHDAAVLQHDVGIRFNGGEKHNVEEYCISEGWIRVAVGKTVDRKGNPLTMKVKGTVEPFYRDET